MATSHYEWEPGQAYPEIQQHSIAKHEILDAYLKAYIQTLASNPRREEFKLALVDGFAGGGAYRHATSGEIVYGSPFIMLRASKEAEYLINKDRNKPIAFNFEYFFVEKSRKAKQCLEFELKYQGYGSRLDQDIFLMNSEFDTQAGSIIEHIKKKSPRAGRAIFLLDQYGYSQVGTGLINKIIREVPGSEVILTFAVDALINYVSDKSETTQKLLNKIGTPDVLRGRTLEDIKCNERDWRLFIQSCLYQDLVEMCGAQYYTLFFIRSAKGHGDYWLIHFSKKARARDVMTRIHWQKNTNFIHYGGPGMNMFSALGYVPRNDDDFTGQADFFFNEDARARSVRALMEQIPDFVRRYPFGIKFDKMFAATCNLSPASADVYKEAIGNLIAHGEVDVQGEDGSVRKMASSIKDSDLVMPPRQRNLFF